jgi:hypothetical protein
LIVAESVKLPMATHGVLQEVVECGCHIL